MSLPLLIRQIFSDLIIDGAHQNFRFRSDPSGVLHLKNEFAITDLIPAIMDLKLGDVNHNAFTLRYTGNSDATKNELGLYAVINSIIDTKPIFKVNQATKEFTFLGKAYFTKDDGTTALIGTGGGSTEGITLSQLNNILAAKTWTSSQITDFNAAVGNYLNTHDLLIPYTILRKNNPQTQKIQYKRYDTLASGYSGGAWTIDEELDQDVDGLSHVLRNLDSTRRIQLDKFLNSDSTFIELNFIDSDGYNKIFKIEKKLTDNFSVFNIKTAVDVSDSTGLHPVEYFNINAKYVGIYAPLVEFLHIPRSTNNMQPITDDYSLVHKLYVDTAISALNIPTGTIATQNWVTAQNYVASSVLSGYVTSADFNIYKNSQTTSTAYDSTLYSQVDTGTNGNDISAYLKNIKSRVRYIYSNLTVYEDYICFRQGSTIGFGTGYSYTDSSNYEWSFRERNQTSPNTYGSVPLLQFKTISGVKSIVAPYKLQASGWTPSSTTDLTTKGSVDNAINALCPVGTIILFVQNVNSGLLLPTGWLQCNGATFSSTTYPDLFLARSSTTLPNLTAPSGAYYIIKALKTSS